MGVTIVSGWHPAGYDLYGRNFAEGFDKFWPADHALAVYTEQKVALPRGECRSLWDCSGVGAFIERHKNNEEACGRKPNKLWKEKFSTRGYNFRFDAVKFCKQLFIPEHAALHSEPNGDEIIVWLDGDVKTDAPVPADFIRKQMGDDDLIYLGRTTMHSEIGFWACRNNGRGQAFMTALADCYRTDAVFKLNEWHSAFVFDHVRHQEQTRRFSPLRVRNMTPTGHGHVWFQSPLRDFSDHLKGNRKVTGKSPERVRG